MTTEIKPMGAAISSVSNTSPLSILIIVNPDMRSHVIKRRDMAVGLI
ncbi:hypothetical protein [Kiloniella majae]|nr:hypothetical protein [Kiloniella majae]